MHPFDPNEPLVDLRDAIPGIALDIRYAVPQNFFGRAVYPVAAAYLRRSVAEMLGRAADDLHARGYALVVWDAYRPLGIQRILWEMLPDDRYVAPPSRGSNHNRGAAVDVTLRKLDGSPLAMPTEYDDFSERAHTANPALSPDAIANREILHRAMIAAGFVPISTEWWHFNAPRANEYPLLDWNFAALIPAEPHP